MPAQGCGVRVIDSRTQIFLPLLHMAGDEVGTSDAERISKNLPLLEKEVEKMNKRKKKLLDDIAWVDKKVSSPYYFEKVPLEVRHQDQYALVSFLTHAPRLTCRFPPSSQGNQDRGREADERPRAQHSLCI